jgi:ribonucleoside-diphosphate reductase beta chain
VNPVTKKLGEKMTIINKNNKGKSRVFTLNKNNKGKKPFSGDRKPSFGDRRSKFSGDRKPSFGDRRSKFSGDRKPSFGDRRSNSGDRKSSFGDRRSNSRDRKPPFGDRRSKFSGDRKSSFGDRRSKFSGDRKSSFGDRRSKFSGDRKPSFGDRRSKFSGDRKSSFGDRRSNSRDRKSSFGDRRSKFSGDRKSSFGDRRSNSRDRKPPFGDRGGKLRGADFTKKQPRFLVGRKSLHPIEYPQFLEYRTIQEKLHWLPQEVPLQDDKIQFMQILSDMERRTIERIFSFFTQMDLDIGGMYVDYYIPYFSKNPEICMMLVSFAYMEGIHTRAYDRLREEVGLKDRGFEYIQKHKVLADKYDFMHQFNPNNRLDVLFTMAISGAFLEGAVLFASFAIINYFPLQRSQEKCLFGVGQIVTLSLRDEELHSRAMINLFHTCVEEMGVTAVELAGLYKRIYDAVRILFDLECQFIDFCMSDGDLDGLTRNELKEYVKYIMDLRFRQLKMEPIFGYDENSKNPIPWTELYLKLKENTNFFNMMPTNYSSFSNAKDGDLTEDCWK